MSTNSPVASVTIKDTDAAGNMDLSVHAIHGGHHLNILAKWIYDRAQNISEAEGMSIFGNPDGAIGECTILVSENGERVKVSVDFGEEGSRDDFNPLSHQLGMFLVEEILIKLGAAHSH